MRICYLGRSAPLFREIAGEVARQGHQVSFVTFYSATDDPWYRPDVPSSVQVFALPRPLKWRFFDMAVRLRAVLREVAPDILHCHYAFPYGIHGALSFHERFVLSLHGSDAYYRAWRMSSPATQRLDLSGLGPPMFAATHRALARRAKLLVLGSPDLVQVATELGYVSEKMYRADYGVNPQLFRPLDQDGPLRGRLLDPLEEGQLVISTRGFNPVYAPAVLLRAFRKVVNEMPDTVLILAGDGPEEESLRREIRALRLDRHVKLIGLVPHDELARYLNACDMFCSVAYSDTSALSVLEAMACGLPVLATRVGSIPERINAAHGGTLVEPGDVGAISEGLVALLRDPEGRREIGNRNAAFIASNLPFDKTIASHIEAYDDLL